MSKAQGWILIGAVDMVVGHTAAHPIPAVLWGIAGLFATVVGTVLIVRDES